MSQERRERRSQERRAQERRDRESRERQNDNRGRSRSRNNDKRRSRSRDKTKLKFTQEQFDTQRVELEKGFKTKKEQSRARFEEAIATALAIERGERSTEVLSLKAKITALEAKLAAQPPEAPAQAERLLNGHPLVGRYLIPGLDPTNGWKVNDRSTLAGEPIWTHSSIPTYDWISGKYWQSRPYHLVNDQSIRCYSIVHDSTMPHVILAVSVATLQIEAEAKTQAMAKSQANAKQRQLEGKGQSKSEGKRGGWGGKGKGKGKSNDGKGHGNAQRQGRGRGQHGNSYAVLAAPEEQDQPATTALVDQPATTALVNQPATTALVHVNATVEEVDVLNQPAV